MLDFLMISAVTTKKGGVEIFPKFRLYPKSKDLMVRGGDFYAVWIEELGLWSTEEDDALQLIDRALDEYVETNGYRDTNVQIRYMWDSSSGMVDQFHKFCQKQMRDSYKMLDETLIFSNTETKRENYASKKLNYPLAAGSIASYDKLIGTLYTPAERHKLEWAIGAIVSGDSKHIQKFMVLYGAAGTGKSTILNIIQALFEGYYCVFDAKALGSNGNSFALEAFRKNPLVAIQHDGDLSRIEDNTRLNSLVSHEEMTVNEKYTKGYSNRFKCFLIMGTNRPVKITDGKSGLLRRLIDVTPSGKKVSAKDYKSLTKKINFELGAIAQHCLDVYMEDPDYYNDYVPTSMMSASNDFYNYVMDSYSVFRKEDGTTLKASWEMYKTYCDEAKIQFPFNKRVFKEELKNYFWKFEEEQNGNDIISCYSGFKTSIFENELYGSKPIATNDKVPDEFIIPEWLDFKKQTSIFDEEYADCPAQLATKKETPTKSWSKVTTKLSDINTNELHYAKVPKIHIVIDFDKKGKDGKKSFEENVKEASKWPKTYGELSKSGEGIHLHYLYIGEDVEKLSRIYDDNIEIKVFSGDSSLRRKLTKCNNIPISTISSGLPLKAGGKSMLNFDGIKSEQALRTIIKRHLTKEIMGHTKSSIQMINKCLNEAYDSGLGYDVSDLQNAVFALAVSSTNNADYCMKMVNGMKFKSEEINDTAHGEDCDELVFYDCEVFPNLFLVNWKFAGEDKPVVRMINPKPADIEQILKFKLVGFNCRRYDNHMLYACLMGYTNEELYNLSQKIVSSKKGENRDVFFGEAYNLSYTDVYDFAAKKQSLKKWEIELGIKHHELGLPWDKPVSEDKWILVSEYCDDDVLATEAVFNHLKGDWIARQILADLAGGSVNDTTNSLTTKIIFGSERNPQLVYTDLATGEQFGGRGEASPYINAFPGYEYVWNEQAKEFQNVYRGTNVGKGGYVYAEPNMYGNVAVLDVASMHPHSILAMNCFGEYTERFKDIIDARIAIKHKDFDTARNMLGGKLAKYLDDENAAGDLAQALKISINSVYGLTSAKFKNPFKDNRNKNNIVALRGALFMRTLQDEVNARGFIVSHIKTDSIKIPDATPEIIQFVIDFAKPYGYTFEFESLYDKMCLVNGSTYIAKYATAEKCKKLYGTVPGDNKKHDGEWTATAAQFQIPYVFKTLFSKESITFEDLCETKEVKTAMYLDMNEPLPDVSQYEKELKKTEDKYKKGQMSDISFEQTCNGLMKSIEEGHDYHFIGKVSNFCPIKSGCGGGDLVRSAKNLDGSVKYDAVTGTKDYRWLEANVVQTLGKEDDIDMAYYTGLVDDAIETISQYGDFEWFASDDPYIGPNEQTGQLLNTNFTIDSRVGIEELPEMDISKQMDHLINDGWDEILPFN